MVDSPRGSRASRRKTPTIYDVAREARVSVFTVSAVINNKSHVGAPLKKRVDAAILKLNYRPNSLAQSLANERTRTLGVIVPDISNPFFPMLVRGAEDTARSAGTASFFVTATDFSKKKSFTSTCCWRSGWMAFCSPNRRVSSVRRPSA